MTEPEIAVRRLQAKEGQRLLVGRGRRIPAILWEHSPKDTWSSDFNSRPVRAWISVVVSHPVCDSLFYRNHRKGTESIFMFLSHVSLFQCLSVPVSLCLAVTPLSCISFLWSTACLAVLLFPSLSSFLHLPLNWQDRESTWDGGKSVDQGYRALWFLFLVCLKCQKSHSSLLALLPCLVVVETPWIISEKTHPNW